MKYSVALVAAGAAIVAAQSLDSLPDCGVSQLLTTLLAIGISRVVHDM